MRRSLMRKLPAVGAHWDLVELRPGRCWIAVARFEARHCSVKCVLLQACVAIQVDAAAAAVATLALAIYAAPFLATPHTGADKAVTRHLIYDGSLLCRACHNKNKQFTSQDRGR